MFFFLHCSFLVVTQQQIHKKPEGKKIKKTKAEKMDTS